MPDIKRTFITRALANYNQDIITTMGIVARRAGIGVTNEGIQSLAYKTAASGSGAASSLSFKEYLRMVDMGAGRGHPLGGLTTTKIALQSSNKIGINQIKDRTRKPKTFLYSKLVYGKLTNLQNQLLYGYTEETIAMLKAEFKNSNTNPE